MSELEDALPERGDPSEWVALSEEESRKYTYLQKYYVYCEEASETVAMSKAWEDIKRECPRLAQYKWYR